MRPHMRCAFPVAEREGKERGEGGRVEGRLEGENIHEVTTMHYPGFVGVAEVCKRHYQLHGQ